MITVQEAQKIILQTQEKLGQKELLLKDSLHRILAKDVHSKIAIPGFDNSAMDGYALAFENELTDEQVFQVVEDIPAGKQPQRELSSGECARIMTGAPLPKGAKAVVMQEHVAVQDDTISIQKPVKVGENIRYQGEEIQPGQKILSQGTLLSPSHISLLSSLGETTALVFNTPRVTIIPTGSELAMPGTPLTPGQIYESTSIGLKLALQEIGIPAIVTPIVKDDPTELRFALSQSLKNSTHVLLCGGVSVGDYDFNKDVLAALDVETLFWKVSQKPGKPLYFGKKQNALVFGLPGNPVSSMVCFYKYIRPCMLKAMGHDSSHVFLSSVQATLTTDCKKKKGRSHFVRAQLSKTGNEYQVTPLSRQGSHMMSGLADANALMHLTAEQENVTSGTSVEVFCLPNRKENL